jgi:hypothetical protein
MHRFKLPIILLLIVFAPAAGLWLARAPVAEYVLSKTMRNAGVEDFSSGIEKLDLNRTRLSQLKFAITSNNVRIQLGARDIDIEYTPGLLAAGRVESLAINNLAIHYTAGPSAQAGTDITPPVLKPAAMIAAFRQALNEYLVVNTLSINSLRLEGEPFGALENKPLQFELHNDAGKVQATLSLMELAAPAETGSTRQFVISELTADTLVAELRFPDNENLTPADIHIKLLDRDKFDSNIAGSYQLDVQGLQKWLMPLTGEHSSKADGKIRGAFTVDFGNPDTVISTLTATSDRFSFNSYVTDKLDINFSTQYSNNNTEQHIKLDNSSYLKTENFRFSNVDLKPGKIHLEGELVSRDSHWNYSGSIGNPMTTLGLPSQTIKLKDFNAQLSANAEKISLKGSFGPAELPGKFGFTVDHNLVSAAGKFSVTPLKAISLDADTHKLSQLVTPWPYPFDLLAGSLQVSADGAWSQKQDFRLDTKVRLDDAGGNVGELLFSGLALEHELEILPILHSVGTFPVTLAHIDSGVSASNISTRLELKAARKGPLPLIAIQDLRGEIFDGSFSAEDFVFDLNKKTNRITVNARDIDLAKIIETQQLEDISVTGRIDGSVPIEISERGISIEHGAFINDVRAGTIRYNPAAGTDQLKQNPLTGITLDALRDFRYSELFAGVSFTPEGVLTVDLKLKGISPELDSSRPVHLNINTEQNLLSLLKSLRYAKGVSDAIDTKVRRQYEKSHQ